MALFITLVTNFQQLADVTKTMLSLESLESLMDQVPILTGTPSSSSDSGSLPQSYKFAPVNCAQFLADAANETKRFLDAGYNESSEGFRYLTDPNLGERLHRNTTTDPTFAISVHTRTIDPVRWSIMERGIYYERDLIEHFKSILHGQTPGIVVDIGMNIGWYTLQSASMGHHVVSLDPNPMHHVRVCQSKSLNHWSDTRVTQYEYGVGDKLENLTLEYGLARSGEAFLRSRGPGKKYRVKVERQVPVLTLDDLAQDRGWLTEDDTAASILLLKVDVESHEVPVFTGAQRLLQAGIVENIIAEIQLRKVEALTKIMAQSGYFLFQIMTWSGSVMNQYTLPSRPAADDKYIQDYVEQVTTLLKTAGKNKNMDAFNTWWKSGE